MAETLLINKAEILVLWPQLDFNTSEVQVTAYTKRSQQGDLKPLLGSALYYDVTTNAGTTPNALLIDGGEYTYNGNTIFFSGIKEYLAASIYSRILNHIGTSAAIASVVEKQTEQSTALPIGLVKQRSREAESEAIRLQAELIQFLDTESSEYPLWSKATGEAKKRTSFRISKVPRHSQR